MRYAVPVILLMGVVAVLWLSGGAGEPPADYRFISRGSVNILDPAMMSYMQDIRMAQAIWEGLTSLDPKTTEPIEGTAYFPPEKSADQRRYVFTIRPEAKWSNGDPVTAADYLRGWRRAIEPGTADVYAELLTKNIAGAKEYVDWRTEQVAVLGLIRQLQRGSPIKPETVHDALTGRPGRILCEMIGATIPDPVPKKDDPLWDDHLGKLKALDKDWRTLGDRLLDEHIEEMERRFARVRLRAIDDRHLEVHLARPISYFLDLTAFSTYLPVHESIELLRERYETRPVTDAGIVAYDSQWTKPDYHRNDYPGLIGNGPFRLTEWVFRRKMRLEKNPHYWDADSVALQSAELVDIEYQNTAFMLYERGAADMMSSLTMDYTPELVAEMRAGRRDDIHHIPGFGTYYYTFNCREKLPDGGDNPLADARVRRALTMAVDKAELVDHVIRLDNPVATTFVPRGTIRGYQSPEGLPYDPERARQELVDAGYPDGEGLPTLKFLYNTGFNHGKIGEAVTRMWATELGIKVELDRKETKVFAEDKEKGRYVIGRSGWYGDYPDPTTFLDLFQSKNSQNNCGFKNDEYDTLLARADDEVDVDERLRILGEAERLLTEEESPFLPLYQYVNVYAWRPSVKGIYPNPRMQFPIKYIRVEN